MTNTINWQKVLKLSGAYIAYLIGSGFATGQEVMQFFASYGPIGIVGALISMVLFCVLGSMIMLKGYELKLKQPGDIFKVYCGNILGRIIEYFALLFLFSIVVIMIAGTGAVVSEHFKLPSAVGYLGMGVLAMITVILGLNKLIDIIGLIGPVIVVLTIGICGYVFLTHLSHIPSFDTLPEAAQKLQPVGHFWQSAILFFCYNMLAGTVFFTQLGSEVNNKKEAVATAICGAAGLMITVIMMIVAMLVHYSEVIKLEVPLLYIGNTIHPVIALFFAVCIILGIYSTTAPMYWLVKNEAMRFLNPRLDIFVTVALGIIFMLGGTLPFGSLVATIYPFVGYVGAFIAVIIFVHTVLHHMKHQ
ncbi:hypothetical protein C7J88_09370 [Staphylococcus muscae]|uniref:Branched-chain amino acid transport system II carrier protein n=1 Tax=Staphylococcus muscae TaxID=1294 RepID=A0A240BXP4_9STAP|nr:hypothetical protein [Staphylococcus muscae]AVQ34361.1 hypothetical protein C7J88_09370 [Staphylococcus muscae]PNZ03172.1 hypothetical protein CD131_06760 [Staphylococcus muscae]GGA83851.1 hypothetical protein GCM10007183_05080 [Staphylococcus muscae]SNW00445.1 branched-chain amino acid transport system II carrier protein [Staphylococcus muscae]